MSGFVGFINTVLLFLGFYLLRFVCNASNKEVDIQALILRYLVIEVVLY